MDWIKRRARGGLLRLAQRLDVGAPMLGAHRAQAVLAAGLLREVVDGRLVRLDTGDDSPIVWGGSPARRKVGSALMQDFHLTHVTEVLVALITEA